MRESFRSVTASELSEVYSVYLEVFAWLNAKGIRQWLKALPREVFIERQRKGELFAYSIDGRFTAVVTLSRESSSYWTQEIGANQHWWIKSLAVARERQGTRIGERVLRECETFIGAAGAAAVFLDCVDVGFLPGYYGRLGYDELGRKEITYPSGNTFLVALMGKKSQNTSRKVTLREVTSRNREAVLALKVAEAQAKFVANNARTLAQAAEAPEAWLRAVYAGETLVGLLLLHDEHLRDPPREMGYYFLWRLMIDAKHQGKGHGKQALDLLIKHVSKRPQAKRLLTSYHTGEGGPEGFYQSYGFRPTGNLLGEEMEAEIPIKE